MNTPTVFASNTTVPLAFFGYPVASIALNHTEPAKTILLLLFPQKFFKVYIFKF